MLDDAMNRAGAVVGTPVDRRDGPAQAEVKRLAVALQRDLAPGDQVLSKGAAGTSCPWRPRGS